MSERRNAVQRFAGLRWAGVVVLATSLGAAGCDEAPEEPELAVGSERLSPDAAAFPATFARQWMTNLANSVKADNVTPAVAARIYAHAGIALWESVVHGVPGGQSLATQLNGLDELPSPDPGLEYDWPTVLAATMSRLTAVQPGPVPGSTPVQAGLYVYPERVFFEFTTGSQASLTALGPAQIGYRRAAGVSETVIDDSMAYADALADALIAWGNSDGFPEARYKGWLAPEGPDKWVPTGFSDGDKVANPLDPGFGTLRPMVLTSADECEPPPPVPFSTSPASDMYAEALAVYAADFNLSDEQIEIASFWADPPGPTSTPAGHWLALVTQFTRAGNLPDAARAYALTGIGYYDAFVSVWETKYRYNLLRPETYIRRHIDPQWQALWPSPHFPAYTSGHSGVSGASAVLLTALFGNDDFVDNTKLRRGHRPRPFLNFYDAADEAAESRLYGGIHYPMDIGPGVVQGECVGEKVRDRVSI